jgi:hypothetical protein
MLAPLTGSLVANACRNTVSRPLPDATATSSKSGVTATTRGATGSVSSTGLP